MNYILSGLASAVAPVVAETVGNLGSRLVQTIGEAACKKIQTIGQTGVQSAVAKINSYGNRIYR